MGVVGRVSGPVVIGEGLVDAKMFDVVRVGSLGLVGEIIRLVGATATIQVYEDTTGVRPGDPIESTGQALSVELGPGLLTSIYDGVQRPLDVLKKNLGDFITRGFVAPPLDEKKVWEFTATLAPGAEVAGGTILGTVQETPLILHKVIVPPGVRGTLEKLTSGSYTIRDEIGRVRTASGTVPLGLSHKWVVRIPRPVKQKLAPDIPLVTGQRVIDTFFPVAKGGTACIPGPFGSGKCVAGETPVLLGNGSLITIQEAYADARRTGVVTVDGPDEWISLRTPVELHSLVGNRLVRSRTRTLYRGKSDSLIRVRTRTGRTVRVTPVHRLFTIRPDGSLKESMARDLRPGDYVASVRKLPAPATDQRPLEELARLLRHGKSLPIPDTLSPELAELLGLFVAGGYVRSGGTVGFSHPEPALPDRFLFLTRLLFGIEGKIELQPNTTPGAHVASKPLASFLIALATGQVSEEKRIPPSVLASSNEVLGAFLRGFYLGAGELFAGEVEFRTANPRLQTELVYALSRFGVISSLGRGAVTGSEDRRVSVRGVASLAQLRTALRSDAPTTAAFGRDATSQPPTSAAINLVLPTLASTERVGRAHAAYPPRLGVGIEVHDHFGDGERVGAATFRGAMPTADADPVSGPEGGRSSELMDWIYCDEILDVREEKGGPFDVYDFSLPEYGSNFVGGSGGFLLHNTVTQSQLCKWADSDVVVYVGCGERGNEMTEMLATLPKLQDPKSKRPLMERTIMIANTSNMPVAAREASVYTGITIAEYYRDMGYDVALMADSTSRWAEAMREISGRLEEMPGEEGYPAYLGRRVAEFYERAGRVITLSPDDRPGSVTVVGAVSPPGGDTSEPVSQNTLRVTRVFWALDSSLASRRHFPSINWLQSYSLYIRDLEPWYRTTLAQDFVVLRQRAIETLQKEAELQEIVQLVGVDALPEREKAILDIARMLREDFLQQSAYDEIDTYSSIEKQYRMLRAILSYGDREQTAIGQGATVAQLQQLPVRQKLSRMKWLAEADLGPQFDKLELEMGENIASLATAGGT